MTGGEAMQRTLDLLAQPRGNPERALEAIRALLETWREVTNDAAPLEER